MGIVFFSATSAVAQTNSGPAFPTKPGNSPIQTEKVADAFQTNSAAQEFQNEFEFVNADTKPAPGAIASAPKVDPFSDPLIKQIQARHEKAVKGDTKETKALATDLEKWTKQQPDNHLLQAYLGSAYTLESRDAWPGPGKLTYLKNGGRELDAAVAAAPDNPAVRFIRAIDYYELPWIFGKHQTARDDFAWLVKQLDGETNSPYVLTVATQQAIYYYAGLSFRQMSQADEAKKAWQRGAALDPKSELGLKMGIELGKM